MTNRFDVTYERITPESAEYGEIDEGGYEVEDTTLRDALDVIQPRGLQCEANSSPCVRPRWLTFYEVNQGTREFYEEGVLVNMNLHIPDSVTTATARRIARLCGARGF